MVGQESAAPHCGSPAHPALSLFRFRRQVLGKERLHGQPNKAVLADESRKANMGCYAKG
jgi:hypothetical protein